MATDRWPGLGASDREPLAWLPCRNAGPHLHTTPTCGKRESLATRRDCSIVGRFQMWSGRPALEASCANPSRGLGRPGGPAPHSPTPSLLSNPSNPAARSTSLERMDRQWWMRQAQQWRSTPCAMGGTPLATVVRKPPRVNQEKSLACGIAHLIDKGKGCIHHWGCRCMYIIKN